MSVQGPKILDELKEQSDDYADGARLERLAKAQGLVSDEMGGMKGQAANIPGICRTCTHATIVSRGSVEHKETTIMCGILGKMVPHDIMECTDYWKRGQMSLRDMQEIAWFIDNRPPSGQYS